MRAFLLLSLVGISAMISQVAGRRQRPNRPTEVTLTVGGEVLTYTCRTQCPPQQFDTAKLEALAPGKVCSDTGKTFPNLCKMLKKKCRGHQLEFASSGRCVDRRDCKKKCGNEGPEVCVSNSNKRFTNRCRFEKANCLRGPERALTEIPCPTGATGAPPANPLVNARNQEVFIPGHRGEQEEVEVEEPEVEEPETEGAPPFNVPAPAPLIKEPAKQEVFLPFPTDLPPDAGVEGGSELPEGSEVEEPEEDSSEEEEEEEGGSEVASEVSEAQPQGGSDFESQAGPSPSEYEVEEEEEESEED